MTGLDMGSDAPFSRRVAWLTRTPPVARVVRQYFTKKDVDDLSMSGAYNLNGNGTTEWYDTTPGVEVFVGDKAIKIDRDAKTVVSQSGRVRTFLAPPRPSSGEALALVQDGSRSLLRKGHLA